MKKNKYGFTLSEVLLSMMIIGIIMALSVNSIKIVKASYTSLAYFAHKNIVDMVGVLYAGSLTGSTSIEAADDGNLHYRAGKKFIDNKYMKQSLNTDSLIYSPPTGTPETLPSMVTRCVNSKGKIVNVLKTDGELYSSTVSCNDRVNSVANANLFCKSLIALTNNAGKHHCNLVSPSMTHEGEPFLDINYRNTAPNFTLTNGMRVYISSWAKSSSHVSPDYGYRIIAVDLNGKSGPNAVDAEGGARPTDIVSFLVLDNGEVYPLGKAADNLKIDAKRTIQYLNARVKGYYFTHKDSENNVIKRDTTPFDCTSQKESKYKCNFGVVMLENDNKSAKNTNFSYREALCTAKKKAGVAYISYCSSALLKQSDFCPPSENDKGFSMCKVETVKPMFRYNF